MHVAAGGDSRCATNQNNHASATTLSYDPLGESFAPLVRDEFLSVANLPVMSLCNNARSRIDALKICEDNRVIMLFYAHSSRDVNPLKQQQPCHL